MAALVAVSVVVMAIVPAAIIIPALASGRVQPALMSVSHEHEI